MKTKSNKTPPTAEGPCLCQGTGPLLSNFLRRIGPPEAARRHFETARLEVLKGLRALLDARIARVSQSSRKGESIKVD